MGDGNSVKVHGVHGGYIKIRDDGRIDGDPGTALVEVCAGDKTASVRVCVDPRVLAEQVDDFRERAEKWRAKCRSAAQTLIEEIGAAGPESVEDTATRAVVLIGNLCAERDALAKMAAAHSLRAVANNDARKTAEAERAEAVARRGSPNDLVRLAMERAAQSFDPDGNPDNDGIFSMTGFAVALARLSDAKDKSAASIALGAGLVRVILAGRPDVQVLQSHEHYALLARELEGTPSAP